MQVMGPMTLQTFSTRDVANRACQILLSQTAIAQQPQVDALFKIKRSGQLRRTRSSTSAGTAQLPLSHRQCCCRSPDPSPAVGQDLNGADIKAVPGQSAGDCCTICRETPDCGAFTFNTLNTKDGSQKFSGFKGTCW